MIRNKKKFKKSIYISLIIIFIVCLVFFSYKIILNIKDKNNIKKQLSEGHNNKYSIRIISNDVYYMFQHTRMHTRNQHINKIYRHI